MNASNMPPAEVEITATDVAEMVAEQFPLLAGAEVEEAGYGWDNFMFRVGTAHVARFPRRQISAPMVDSEARWLPDLARVLPLPIPAPVFVGSPSNRFPWSWTIAKWIDGQPAAVDTDIDQVEAGSQMGSFLAALHRPAPAGYPHNPFRGGPISDMNEKASERITSLSHAVDSHELLERFIADSSAPSYRGDPLWLHGDLHPSNVIVRSRLVAGVIDFTDLTGGDPACDLMIAWSMFDRPGRQSLFDSYGPIDEATRCRARAWAIHHGAICASHSKDNEVMRKMGMSTLRRVLAD